MAQKAEAEAVRSVADVRSDLRSAEAWCQRAEVRKRELHAELLEVSTVAWIVEATCHPTENPSWVGRSDVSLIHVSTEEGLSLHRAIVDDGQLRGVQMSGGSFLEADGPSDDSGRRVFSDKALAEMWRDQVDTMCDQQCSDCPGLVSLARAQSMRPLTP